MTLNPRTVSQLISLGSSLASIANQSLIKHNQKESQKLEAHYQEFQAALQQKREVVESYFDHAFGERRYALDSLFFRLDQAITKQDYKALEHLVLGIIAVLQQNPLHDFETFNAALQDPNHIIEL